MSNTLENDVQLFLKDLAGRVIHTAWESGAATAVVLWGGSGLHVNDLLTVSGLDKAWTIVAVSTGAAVFTALKATVRGYFKSNVSLETKIVKEIAAQELSHIPPVVAVAAEAQKAAQTAVAASAATAVQKAMGGIIPPPIVTLPADSPLDPFQDGAPNA